MFIQSQKKLSSAPIKPLSHLTPIWSSEQLLADPKRQEMLQVIKETSQFDLKHYETVATRLIQQVAFNCQNLPEGTVYFAGPGGLFDHILTRTVAATKLLREYLLPPPHSHLSDDQRRWWYALFSASLLRGIGTLAVDYRINRYSIKGQFLKQWEPLFENIGQVNHFYTYEFLDQEDRALKRRLTLLLARKLMPEEGLSWLAANKEVFAIWLALLDEDTDGARALGAILDRADSIVIQEELMQLPVQVSTPKRAISVSSFIDQTPEVTHDKERATALEFIRWIQNQIEAGHFLLNRAPIFAVPGGILICIEAFRLFSREHVSYKNWQTVQQALMSLKINLPNDPGSSVSKYPQGEGLVISNSIILPESISYKNEKTGEIIKTTATQLAIGETGMRISNKGDWILDQSFIHESYQPTGRPRG